MWPNPQFPADFVTFTEEIHNEKFHFCVVFKKYVLKFTNNYSEKSHNYITQNKKAEFLVTFKF